jgi:hypothetical protein
MSTGAMLVLLVVAITGGFVIDAGPLHVSARRIMAPLVITLLAWTSAAALGRAAFFESLILIGRFIERHTVALALVLAASAAGAGIAFGTYAASGADAAGYVSQAQLLASGRLLQEEPLIRQVAWPEREWTFAPLGYRPGPNPGEVVPTYPSGLPLTMAGAQTIAGELGPYVVVPLLGALAVLGTMAIGSAVHSRTTGLAAAALLATSPIFLFQIVQPMTDVAVTAWWTLAILFALSPLPAGPLAAGAITGFALLTRPNLFPLVIPVALVSSGWLGRRPPRAEPRRLLLLAAGIAPAIAALLLLQWRLYGHPLATGYGAAGDLFAAANIGPNLRAYAARLLTGETPALSLAALSLLVLAFRPRAAVPSIWPAVRISALVTAALLVCYLPYGVFAEWWYLRFLLPALPFAFVLVGALLTSASQRLPETARGLALLLAVVAACSFNVLEATRQQAFNMRRYEARYRTAGKYLEAMLPPTAVVFAVQESSSVRHYAQVPIVRWDLLRADPDAAIARLRSLGRRPVLLVEDWEAADLRTRFPRWPAASLDWPPRADIGDDTRVLLFDPADRATHPRVTTDRVH